ncbi:MAG: hypothetical protein ABSE48_06820 [Verrucomicrobiota bacterium]
MGIESSVSTTTPSTSVTLDPTFAPTISSGTLDPATLSLDPTVLEPLRRYLRTETKDFADDGTIQVAFSSEYPAQQRASRAHAAMGIAKEGELFWEVLSHEPGDFNLDRMNNSGAFLNKHVAARHLGKIRIANVSADKVGRAYYPSQFIPQFIRTLDVEVFGEPKLQLSGRIFVLFIQY